MNSATGEPTCLVHNVGPAGHPNCGSSFTDADTTAEDQLQRDVRRARHAAVRQRERSRFEMRWRLLMPGLFYEMTVRFSTRFFMKHQTMSKPDIP